MNKAGNHEELGPSEVGRKKNIDGNLFDLQLNNDFITMTPKHGQQKRKKKKIN